jgi:hypothetical protein
LDLSGFDASDLATVEIPQSDFSEFSARPLLQRVKPTRRNQIDLSQLLLYLAKYIVANIVPNMRKLRNNMINKLQVIYYTWLIYFIFQRVISLIASNRLPKWQSHQSRLLSLAYSDAKLGMR